jgi:hypothetical protein
MSSVGPIIIPENRGGRRRQVLDYSLYLQTSGLKSTEREREREREREMWPGKKGEASQDRGLGLKQCE